MAVVRDNFTIFADGFGHVDLHGAVPMQRSTRYPIGSTAKAFNAALLGALADEGLLDWDAPVSRYLPRFQLSNRDFSAYVTVRDLVSMRTGLPRHDFVWFENPIRREDLVAKLALLKLSAGFRERFQYSNLTPSVAGHVAEVITGTSWEDLIAARLLGPLEMSNSGFAPSPPVPSYHEDIERRMLQTRPLTASVMAPVGSTLYSTVDDMTHWIQLQLNAGAYNGRQVVSAEALMNLHEPSAICGPDPSAPSRDATYALGWFVDRYAGRIRLSHTGLLASVNSSIMIFPQERLGLVCFLNFAGPRIARVVNQYVFDLLHGCAHGELIEDRLAQYERDVDNNRRRLSASRREDGVSPPHALHEYVGRYANPAYGAVEIHESGDGLILERGRLRLELRHERNNEWRFRDHALFEVHQPHWFDAASSVAFGSDSGRAIAGLSMNLEPGLGPSRFVKGT